MTSRTRPAADELIGLRVEIPFSPLFREMSEKAQVINVGDVSAGDPRFPYGSESAYKNWLGAPLISKSNVVGVLDAGKAPAAFLRPTLHQQLTLTFANQAAVALDNAQLFEETRARAVALDEQAQRLALLNRVSLALAQSLDLENILEIALREDGHHAEHAGRLGDLHRQRERVGPGHRRVSARRPAARYRLRPDAQRGDPGACAKTGSRWSSKTWTTIRCAMI